MDRYYIDLTRECLHGAIGKLESAQGYAARAELPNAWPDAAQSKLRRLILQARRLSDDLQAVALEAERQE